MGKEADILFILNGFDNLKIGNLKIKEQLGILYHSIHKKSFFVSYITTS